MEKKLTGYNIISLLDMIDSFTDEFDGDSEKAITEIEKILKLFSCKHNKDVDDFLHNKAIEFSRQGLSVTHLIVSSYRDEVVILGYFSLSNKNFMLDKNSLTKSLRKRICKFGKFNNDLRKYVITAPLIGQIGKNKKDGIEKLISGDELLKIACDYVKSAMLILGGRIVYLECEDVASLISFYENNGFVVFGKRDRENVEEKTIKTKELIQLLKFIK